MIPVADGVLVDEREVEENSIRASEPGGQNVNNGERGAVALRHPPFAVPA